MPTKSLFSGPVAKFDLEHKFRYSIIERWGRGNYLPFLMLNPSLADGIIVDPTYTRIGKRARLLEFDGVAAINLYALISPEPEVLWKARDPIGPDNDKVIREILRGVDTLVCAWGTHAKPERVAKIRAIIIKENESRIVASKEELKTVCLGINKDGSPKHPLYVSMDQELIPYSI